MSYDYDDFEYQTFKEEREKILKHEQRYQTEQAERAYQNSGRQISQKMVKMVEESGLSPAQIQTFFKENSDLGEKMFDQALQDYVKNLAGKIKTGDKKSSTAPANRQFQEVAKNKKDTDAVLRALFPDNDPFFRRTHR